MKFSSAVADTAPAILPDLYRDEPLVLAAKLDKLQGSVEIEGHIGDRPWIDDLAAGRMPPKARAFQNYGRARKNSDAEVARTTAANQVPKRPTRPFWRWRCNTSWCPG